MATVPVINEHYRPQYYQSQILGGRNPLSPLPGCLFKPLCIATLLIVNAALGLVLALPTTRTLILTLADWDSRVPITNRLVPPIEKNIVGDVVLLDIVLDLVKGPVHEGVDLDNLALLVKLDDANLATLTTLRPAPAGKHSGNLQFGIGTLQWLNLGDPIIQLPRCLPELFSIEFLELLGCVDICRLENVDVDVVAGFHALNKVICLLEVVESVEKDEFDWLRVRRFFFDLGKHVQCHKARQAERGGLIQVREENLAKLEDFHRMEGFELLVEMVQVCLGQYDPGQVASGRIWRDKSRVDGSVVASGGRLGGDLSPRVFSSHVEYEVRGVEKLSCVKKHRE